MKFKKGIFIYDLVYNPPLTKLLKTAQERGMHCASGLRMLLYQGAFAFEIWTGKEAPLQIMEEALLEAVKL
jgi:shikimate dehydrogenase